MVSRADLNMYPSRNYRPAIVKPLPGHYIDPANPVCQQWLV